MFCTTLNLTFLFKPSTYLLLSLVLTHSFTFDRKRLDGHCPFLISSNNSSSCYPSTSKSSPTYFFQNFICLSLHGLTFHSWLKSCLGYLLTGIDASLCHHLSLALSLRLFKVSNPISPLTASLQVLDEHQRIFFAPPKRMDSKALVWVILHFQTSLPNDLYNCNLTLLFNSSTCS